ncbi:hypothetical protein DFQ11_1373 [Winogradskyella epiphytica]|uniref:Outer membrane protein with beta-barrel domain n=1 Tax=Winogradskyella epiphytica TaxID=262005 RepID=A0A2V4XF79_9FLAO|nr:hypothetical protein [Winogradskyella epiphytica]PYE78343.1 hypothetical protein DFQ11_1373 [Winogradskyella epiphytica]
MKTIKLFFLISFIYTSANAQITEGNWLVGGSGNYSSQTFKFDNGEKEKRDVITIKPNIGYFIKDKFAIGASLRYEKINRFDIYGGGLFSKYYFLEVDKTFNLFAQIHYDYVNTVSPLERGDTSISSSYYGVRVGQVIFFNSVVGLEFAIEYERGNLGSGNVDNIKAVLGFQIHLEK